MTFRQSIQEEYTGFYIQLEKEKKGKKEIELQKREEKNKLIVSVRSILESVSQLPAARAQPGTATAYGASSTGGLAGQFPSRNLRQSSIVERWIRSSSYEFL